MSTAYSPFPDVEAVCSEWLRSSGICSKRVYSTIPTKNPVWPLVIVKRLGGIPVVRQRLDRARIQVDVWGGTKSEARAIADAARVALHELEGTTSSKWNSMITGVDLELGLTYQPDSDTGRDRYIFAVAVYAHDYQG